jgi:hypothetical protein
VEVELRNAIEERLSELRGAIEERMEQSTAAAAASAQGMVSYTTEAMPGLWQEFESVSVDRMKTVLLAIVNVAKPFRGDSVLAPAFAAQLRKIADALNSGDHPVGDGRRGEI